MEMPASERERAFSFYIMKPKYAPGQRVELSSKDKFPHGKRYFIIGMELRIMHGRKEFVYHLSGYDFERRAFQTTSHVPQKMLKPC